MTEFERFAQALALTESNDDPKAWGDSGLACGRWQMHPAFYHDWMPSMVAVRESWDAVFRGALKRFWQHHFQGPTDRTRLAMIFHLGQHAVDSGEWDGPYAEKFDHNYTALGVP